MALHLGDAIKIDIHSLVIAPVNVSCFQNAGDPVPMYVELGTKLVDRSAGEVLSHNVRLFRIGQVPAVANPLCGLCRFPYGQPQ